MSSHPPELGPDRRGPEFAPPSFGGPAGPGQPPSDQRPPFQQTPYQQPPQQRPPRPEPPRPDRKPAIITAAVIAVVVLVVVIASVHAAHSDKQAVRDRTSASPTPQPSAMPSADPNSINFTSSEGSGRLTLLSHGWTAKGARTPRYGKFLQIDVKISASAGHVSYGPEFFQSFDETGNLFQTTEVGAKTPLLGEGVLQAGQQTTGNIAFDMPRGAVTLLMSNSQLESVTALRITD